MTNPIQVLVAEDNEVNQLVAEDMLTLLGCSVDIAPNGLAALELMQSAQYDVVFMDCQMPVMDGFEATAKIRAAEDDDTASVPVIAMTAHAMAGDEERCIAAGMNDYITKPVDMTQLEQLLEKWAS